MSEGTAKPSETEVRAWLMHVTPDDVHETMWPNANLKFSGLIRALRPYVSHHFPVEQQEAVFDGVALALGAALLPEERAELEEILLNPGGNTDTPESDEQIGVLSVIHEPKDPIV